MAIPAPQRSWLLDPSILQLVHKCRRLIRSEFGVKLHLTEENLAERLATYVHQSRSTHLAHIWESLRERVPGLTEEKPEEAATRMYRGQAIPENRDEPRHDTTPGPEVLARRKKVIYRGQVVG